MKILKITNLKTGQVQQSDFKSIDELEIHFNSVYWGGPGEFTKEIFDTDSQEEAEMVKKAAKVADRSSRINQLKAIDWQSIDSIEKLKAIVKTIAKEILKDEE